MSTQDVIEVNVWWRVRDVVVSGCLGMLEELVRNFAVRVRRR